MELKGKSFGAGALTLAMLAAITTATPTTPAQANPAAEPLSSTSASPPSVVASARAARGVLKVKVTGTGSYTIRANGYRKTGTVTKSLRVKPGKYTVKAPGAVVKPKVTVRVRKGKTTTVRVRFLSKAPAPGPTPTPTSPPSPAPSESPKPPPPADVVVARDVSLSPGSSILVDLAPELESVTKLTGGTSKGYVSWSVANGQLEVAVTAGGSPGNQQIEVTGTGCRTADECSRSVLVAISLQVGPLQAPPENPVDSFTSPSGDRVDAATQAPLGVGHALADEVTLVLGTDEQPGTRSQADEVASSVGAVVTGGMQQYGIYQLRWTTAQDIDARIQQLRTHPLVAGVDRALLLDQPTTAVPAANPPGEAEEDSKWPLTQMRVPQAWEKTTGVGVRVGIVDVWTVDDHVDLNVVSRTGPHQGDLNSQSNSTLFHATHVAGIACALGNGQGIVGVAPDCGIASDSGRQFQGGSTFLATAVDAARRVIDSGARVVNVSLGFNPGNGNNKCLTSSQANEMRSYFGSGQDTETAAAFRRLAARNPQVLFTVAAGNDCSYAPGSPFSAADALDNVISVASVNKNGRLSSFSNWDAEVAAGGGVTATDDNGVWSTIPQNDYTQYFGTSMAAPLVAGTAALVMSGNPGMDARQVGRCITMLSGPETGYVTARDDDAPSRSWIDPITDFNGKLPIVDAEAAVECGIDPPPHPKTGNDYIARNPQTGRAVLVKDGQRYAIPDGGTFNCLANSRVVWDIPNLKALVQEPPTSVAGCVTSDQGDWTYTPTAQGGNTGTNIILRDSADPGHNWLINSAGEIQTIEDGGTYLCLAAVNPVIWNVPDDRIDGWTPVGTKPAQCHITFDDIPSGTAISNQYSGVSFSPSFAVDVSSYGFVGNSQPNVLYPEGGWTSDVMIVFSKPTNDVHLSAIGVDETGTVGKIEVVHSGGTTQTDLIGHSGRRRPEVQDLSMYRGVTRIRLFDITDPLGIGWDDLFYTVPAGG